MIACADCAYYRSSDPTAVDICLHPTCAADVPDYVHGVFVKLHLGVDAARGFSGHCTPSAVLFEPIPDTRSSVPVHIR